MSGYRSYLTVSMENREGRQRLFSPRAHERYWKKTFFQRTGKVNCFWTRLQIATFHRISLVICLALVSGLTDGRAGKTWSQHIAHMCGHKIQLEQPGEFGQSFLLLQNLWDVGTSQGSSLIWGSGGWDVPMQGMVGVLLCLFAFRPS